MGLNQTRRGIQVALDIAGVDTSRGQQVSEEIQLTYQLSDLSGLINPLPRPTMIATVISPTTITRRGMVEISPPADSAIIVVWVRNDDAIRILWRVSVATQIIGDLTAQTADAILGAPSSRALLQSGTGNVGNIILAASAEFPANFPPLVIPPGQFLAFTSNVNNDAAEITLAWHEIPIAALTTP